MATAMAAVAAVVTVAAKAGTPVAPKDVRKVVQTDAARDAAVADAVVVVANARAAHNANDSIPKANHWICRPPPARTPVSNRPFANHARTVARARSGESAADAKARAVARPVKAAKTADQHHAMKCVVKRHRRATTRPVAKASAMKPRVKPARAEKVDAVAGAVVAGVATTGAHVLTIWATREHRKTRRHRMALRRRPQSRPQPMTVNVPSRATTAKCVKSAPVTAMVVNVLLAVNATTHATSVAIAQSKTLMPAQWMRQARRIKLSRTIKLTLPSANCQQRCSPRRKPPR